jgi:hypothetical protein
MTLGNVALLVLGLAMVGTGAMFVVRFAARNRMDRPRARSLPEGKAGPVFAQRALLGALLISLGLLLTVLGALLIFAPRTG